MSVAVDVAVRFLLNSGEQFARFITWVSFVGLLLGVMVLTVVVSVMNGFDDALKSRLLTAVPHVVIEDLQNPPADLARLPGVNAAFEFYEGTAMIARGRAVTPVSVYGLGNGGAAAATEINAHMRSGAISDLQPGSRLLVAGAPLAAHLGLALGDDVSLVFPMPTGAGLAPVQQRFQLGGTFELGAELDVGLVLVALNDLPLNVLTQTGALGVQLRIDEPMRAGHTALEVQKRFPESEVTTWMQRFGDLFQAVRMEKAMMFIILLLVVAVAAFNIVSGQYMLVRKKTAAIAIMRTMGADNQLISRIFLLQGTVIGVLGIIVGLTLGVFAAQYINSIVSVLEGLFDVHFLGGTYFATIPVVVQASDLVAIAALSGVIVLAAAYLPARRARSLSPIAGLHGF